MLNREWRRSWSSADRRCSNYIWMIKNVIAYWGVSYIRGFTLCIKRHSQGLVLYLVSAPLKHDHNHIIIQGEEKALALSCYKVWTCEVIFNMSWIALNKVCQTCSISHTKSQNLNVSRLVSSVPIHWSQVLSREWRCSWRSANRCCSNYIWVINNCIAR